MQWGAISYSGYSRTCVQSIFQLYAYAQECIPGVQCVHALVLNLLIKQKQCECMCMTLLCDGCLHNIIATLV